jgi:hypothetical protein
MSEIPRNAAANKNTDLTVSEILFGALMAAVAVGSIWISSSLMLHLFNKL